MDNKKATLALGTEPVGKLLVQYATPAIVAMVASSLYNIIDRAIIGQVVGADAIAGLGITFPFMNLSGAFGAAVGVGASTCISVKLGQKDYKTAEHLLGNTVTLNLIVGLAFMTVCLLFLDPILRFFGASDVTLPYARSFMQVILLGNMITHMYFGMNAVLRAAGKPRHAMWAVLFTVGMNILLAVTFVWWFRWGIRGAALATVISQSMALCWQMWLFSDQSQLLHLRRGIYRLKSSLVKKKLQLIQQLEKPCADEETLLKTAMASGAGRIIVKRPVKGPYLAGVKPGYSISGKVIRYDCIVKTDNGQ